MVQKAGASTVFPVDEVCHSLHVNIRIMLRT